MAELEARGLVHSQTHEDLGGYLDREQFTLYCGFDPTAVSLQVGNLVPLLTLARFQQFGHRPIVVLGGGTGMIGDPSGKSAERILLDQETLARNAEAQRRQFESLLSFYNVPAPALMVDNLDWLAPLDLIGFLRDVGKHFPLSVMLSPRIGQSAAGHRGRDLLLPNSPIRRSRPTTSCTFTANTVAGCRSAVPTNWAISSPGPT